MSVPLLPDYQFAEPGWFWLLPLAVAIALLGNRARRSPAIDFGAMAHFGASGRRARGAFGLLSSLFLPLAAAAAIAALARPQKVDETEFSSGEGIEIALAIDVSASMSVLDYEMHGQRVDRLTVAKQVLKEFVDGRPNDRVGLVIFAGEPYPIGPLTMDHGWVQEAIDREVHFGHEILGGTAIGQAIALPAKKLSDREAKSRIVVLITDGAQEAPGITPQEAAALAATLGIKVYPIAIGTPGTHYSPLRRAMIPSNFDFETLEEVAAITEAKAFRGRDTEALRDIFAEIDTLEKSEVERRTIIKTVEFFQWPAAAAALLVLLGLVWELGPGRVAPD